MDVVEKTIRYLNFLTEAMGRLRMPRDAAQIRKLSLPAFDKTGEGMQALSRLNSKELRIANLSKHSINIEKQRVNAASHIAFTTPATTAGRNAMSATIESQIIHGSDEVRWEKAPQRSAFLLEKWDEYVAGEDAELQARRPYIAAMEDFAKRYGSVHALDGLTQGVALLERAVSGIGAARLMEMSAYINRASLSLQMLILVDVSGNSWDKIHATFHTHFGENSALQNAVDLLQDPRMPVLPQEAAWLECQIQMLHHDALDFFMEALLQMRAETPPGEPPTLKEMYEKPLWRTAVHVGEAIRTLTDCLHEAMQVPKLPQAVAQKIHGRTPLGQATHRPAPTVDQPLQAEEVTAADPASGVAAGSANEAPQPSGRRKSQKARAHQARTRAEAGGASGAQALAASSQPARAALTAKGEAVLEMAQQRLKGFLPPAEPLAGGDDRLDILALGEALGKDTSAVRMALEQRIDPLSTANLMRSALTSWFGEPSLWKKQLGQLNELQEPEHPLVAKAIAAFQERIAGVERLHGQLRQVESDLVKTCDYPMASHVAKLLELDAVQDLGRLRLLPSQGDPDGAHGTLFEVKVRLHACSDGREAAPLYLHLHTREATDAGACKTLAFEDLAAVHVKTAAQRSLGASWEALQASLQVEDAKVHRGSIPAALLATLQQRMPG